MLNLIKANQTQIFASAVTFALYHVVGLDFGADIERAIHHEVAHIRITLEILTRLLAI